MMNEETGLPSYSEYEERKIPIKEMVKMSRGKAMDHVSDKYWYARKSWYETKGNLDGFDDWFLALVKNRI